MICPNLQRLLVVLMLPALAMTGCRSNPVLQAQDTGAGSQVQSSPSLKVVTTFLPIYWFTKAVTGDTAAVQILVPPGSEVHEYQATPKDVQAIAQANVLVKNGLGLEEFLESTVKNAQNNSLKVIDASASIQPLQQISPVVEPAQASQNHDHTAGNPHVWLDPILAIQQVKNIRDGLIAANPENKVTYEANAAAYIQQLERLDRQFKQGLQKYPNCTFITFHDAYPYLTKRYQLKQIAVVSLPEDQLSPADIQKTINTIKQYKVKALFGEPGTDNKFLTSLSKDLNLTLRSLDSLENGSLDPQHYFTAMQANLKSLESACH